MKTKILASVIAVASFVPAIAFTCDKDHSAHSASVDSLPVSSAHADTAATADGQKARIHIEGLHCSSCEKSINANLKKVNGVTNVTWDKKKNIVEVTYAKGSTTPAALVTAITSAGDEFKASIVQ